MLKIITAKSIDEAEEQTYALWNESDENIVAWDLPSGRWWAYQYAGSSGVTWQLTDESLDSLDLRELFISLENE